MTRDELLRAWVAALESGKYRQGRRGLRHVDSYCCLGVFCDISGRGKWMADDCREWPGFKFEGRRYGMFLPPVLRDEIGMSERQQGDLTAANDDGETFPQIAQRIRRMSPDVFPVAA